MTTEEALKIAAPIATIPAADRSERERAIVALADALREAEAQTVQMREVVRQDHCDYGDACVLHKMKEVVSTLPAPAVRTYEDGVRDAARVVRARSERTFGQQTTTANGYADAIEALLSPAPAVAPVAAPKPGPTNVSVEIERLAARVAALESRLAAEEKA